VALISIAPRVVEKQIEFSSSQNTLSFRAGIWRSGIAAWEEYPWFGVGKNNYEAITPELIGSWRAAAGKEFDRSRFERAPHAHNLYVNTLAERGILGLVTLALAMLGILVALVRCRPRPEDGDAAWISWSGAASAWIVTAGIGTVNTTLHHEHGLLAMLLTAIWLTTLRTRRAS
jgi:O-antigen ligase